MGYYIDLLNKINKVEAQGFNPYTDSLANRVAQLPSVDTNVPQGGDNGLQGSSEPISDTTNVANPTQVSNEITMEEYSRALDVHRQNQADMTRLFQEKHPDVPVGDLLSQYTPEEKFNTRLDSISAELNKQFGDYTLSREDVKDDSVKNALFDAYFANQKILKDYEEQEGLTIKTRGQEEKHDEEEKFGWRNLVKHSYTRKEDEDREEIVPYQYLIDSGYETTKQKELEKEKGKKQKENKKQRNTWKF